MRRHQIILFTALLLTSCANIPLEKPSVENRPVCEVGREKSYVVIMLGWFGIALKLTDDSTKSMCDKT